MPTGLSALAAALPAIGLPLAAVALVLGWRAAAGRLAFASIAGPVALDFLHAAASDALMPLPLVFLAALIGIVVILKILQWTVSLVFGRRAGDHVVGDIIARLLLWPFRR